MMPSRRLAWRVHDICMASPSEVRRRFIKEHDHASRDSHADSVFAGVLCRPAPRTPHGRSGTVTIVTPFAPGGIADVVARLTAERLQIVAEAELRRRKRQPGAVGHGRARSGGQGYAGRLHADVDADLPAHHGEVHAQRNVRRRTRLQTDLGRRLRAIRDHGDASFPGKTLADFIAHVKANPGKIDASARREPAAPRTSRRCWC